MKIRTALTIKNTLATAAVFLFCLLMVYIISEHNRSNTFFHDLRGEAVTKAHLFLSGKADAEVMQSIYWNNRKFINEVEVAVYDTSFTMLYHDAVQNDIVKEDSSMVRNIIDNKYIEFYIDDFQAIGMLYTYNGHDYVVTAAAYDGYGYDNLLSLRNTILILFIIGLALLAITGYFLSRSALKPIRNIVAEAEQITATEISRRLPVGNEKDELGELSTTFNELLSRLEHSFNSQKMFVSNVSHELRTPLAALMAELGISLQRERSMVQYRETIENAMQDAQRMNRLIDGLLNLAKADYGKEQISMQEIRLDELLLDVRECILRAHPDYHIELVFGDVSSFSGKSVYSEETVSSNDAFSADGTEYSEDFTCSDDDFADESCITVMGNLYLLNIAFSNLIENNCKYSADKTSIVQISSWDKWAVLRFSDDGAGFSEEEKKKLFTLFYRGEKEKMAEGHGIGMALSKKIVTLHQGRIDVHSYSGKGTTFVVEIPHI